MSEEIIQTGMDAVLTQYVHDMQAQTIVIVRNKCRVRIVREGTPSRSPTLDQTSEIKSESAAQAAVTRTCI